MMPTTHIQDVEYRNAINENEIVITKMKTSIEELENQFETLTGHKFASEEQ